jgi:hypothetical protein
MPTATFTSSGTWAVPSNADTTSIGVYATGESGAAGTSAHGSHAGGGSGAGALGGEPALGGLVAGSSTLTFTIGTGGTGTATTVTGGSVTVQGNAGGSASGQTGGNGGTAGSNTIAEAGGAGASGGSGASANGGGGGGSAGSGGPGGAGSGSTGGSAGTGTVAGAAGQSGAGTSSNGANGTGPGGGASGGGSGGATNHTGGSGAPGQVFITWNTLTYDATGYAASTGVMATAKKALSGFKGVMSFTGAPLPVSVVNQWSATFAQPASFGTMPPALQSSVIALTPANSVGGGTGYPSQGNWLFCIAGWQQQNTATPVTCGDADDIHSWWRPGNVTTSTWAVSPSSGATRTNVWYTPNLARQPQDVYVAPNGVTAGRACLVIEVQGLGPWDTVTGIDVNDAAAATSLSLALAAPSAQAFVLAAITGDNDSAGQSFAPGGWTVLETVTATDGTDHLSDAVLTSACITTSGSVSVTGTASSAENLSGVIIGVLTQGPSPIPSSWDNPAWPGRTICEVALGGGFQTPQDELTWTVVSDSAASWRAENLPRLWNWRENSTGIQYQLGALQATDGNVQLDNVDGYLTPSNTESPFYPYITAGLPVRLRFAVGTITTKYSSVTYDRWYVIQRNAYKFTELRDAQKRSYVDVKLTDLWSVASAACPTPYRGEVEADSPGWWWPADDQALAGGVLPTSLRNAAKGSSTVLNIVASPSGVSSQDAYSSGLGFGSGGTDVTGLVKSGANPSVAVYAVAQSAGWMYGDPQVSPQSAQTGNPVTAQPGSASWQQSGQQGDTGSYGWALIANDTFPPVANGVTVCGWWNYTFLGTSQSSGLTSSSTYYGVAGQPYCPLTLCELATSSAPVAILQLDISGHLNLITYNGGTGTSHSIYTASDLRCNAFLRVTVELTQSTYTVYLNAGLNTSGAVSGSCTISASAWSWFIANGDLGSNGGSSAGTGLQHGGNVQVSHLQIYPGLLPLHRELAHYSAAITGCGLLPAPASVQASSVYNAEPTGFTADGTEYQGSYGSGTGGTPFSMSALAVSVAGSYTSGPAARNAMAARGGTGDLAAGAAVFVNWTALAPLVQVYTSAAADTETEASSVLGAGETYTSGYGSGAAGTGTAHVSGGTGASPPTGPSSLGDTVSQRIERCLGYGGITVPMRAIDAAPLLVQAALDVGGQATGQNCINIQLSDDGLLTVDNCGTLAYRARPHLAADTPAWLLGPNVSAGQLPYKPDQSFGNDPVRVWNAILISPYSPDGASLADITPSNAAAVAASQLQYGIQPLSETSYLQSASEILSQANWLFVTFGQLERRVEKLAIDAASHPAAWVFVAGGNVGDVATVADQPFGGPATSGNYRISQIARSISFGANGTTPEASMTVIADPVPASYWS